ncbi:MAG: STAS/SEC14 domain-containing protein [Oscillospiraceae bacterium]|nr:STAS/SEC14 domain-containing protein [Oscillospiraceae bacterium]
MIYYQQPFAEIEYDQVNQVVIVTYKSYMTSAQLREVFNKGLECVEKYKATKMLADSRNFVTIRQEDQEWINNDYMPRAVKTTIKKFASVLPENMIQKQVLAKMRTDAVKKVPTGSQGQSFASIQEAMNWLTK